MSQIRLRNTTLSKDNAELRKILSRIQEAGNSCFGYSNSEEEVSSKLVTPTYAYMTGMIISPYNGSLSRKYWKKVKIRRDSNG